MKIFVVILAMVGAALAAPQAILGGVPRPTAPRGEEAPPITSVGLPFGFPDIFRRFPFGGGSGFPFGSGFLEVPSDLPDNYDNSTHEVKVINGTRLEMNTTTTKHRGDNGGIFITHIHTVRRLPGEGGASPDVSVESDVEPPQEDVAENEVVSETSPLPRSRRWIEWFNTAARHTPVPFNFISFRAPSRHPNALPAYGDDTEEEEEEEEQQPARGPDTRIPIRNDEDIAVNYLGDAPRPANPDAEVFDVNLLREDERKFFEGRSRPMTAQPMMSQPIRSQPMRAQPIRSQPMRAQPMRSQAIRYQPSRYQPMRSQPMRSQSMRAEPVRSQPLRTRPRL